MTTATLVANARAAAGESVLVRAIGRVVAPFRPCEPHVDPDIWAAELEELRSDLTASRAGRRAIAVAEAVSRAWAHAAVRASFETGRAFLGRLTVVDRVRAAGIWAISAGLTVGLLTPLDPRPVSRARWAIWAAFLTLGAIAALAAAETAERWFRWRARSGSARKRASS